MSDLTRDELVRYARHLILPEVGAEGQRKLRDARVLLVGAGGLGSPAALYLAAAGVGTLGIADFDAVDAGNLQRQILHGSSGVGRPKLESAEARLRDLNPHVRVEPIPLRLDASNALDVVGRYDVALDGSDNFPTRYLVNDASVLTGRPYVYGSILRFDGQVSVFAARQGPCYRCLFAEPPPPDLVPGCAEAGVLGVLPGVIGSLMATEAIKLVLGVGEPLVGRLLLYDALRARFRDILVHPDPQCPVCGPRPSIRTLIDYEAFCGTAAGERRSAVEISPAELANALDGGHAPAIVDVREAWEWDIVRLPESRLIPLSELPDRLSELDRNQDIVVLCHRGSRSLTAQRVLEQAGFRAQSLAGGIDAWASSVDSGLARY